MGRHCFNDWMNCGILISKINIAWILCLHDLCFIRITYDNKIMYEQFSVWSLIKNVIWTYSLWAIYILRLCAQTCTPNRHALQTGCTPKLGSCGKIGIFGQKPSFGAQKKAHFLTLTMLWPRPDKLFKKKSCLFPNKYHSLINFGLKPIFGQKHTFRLNVKMAVSL